MNWFVRSSARVIGATPRALARRLSRRVPRTSYGGIELFVSDPRLMQRAEAFFDRTRGALDFAGEHAHRALVRLRRDVNSIVLWPEPTPSPYHRFQLAVLVPVEVAFDAEIVAYAGWLLYASGLSVGKREARSRVDELIASLDAEQQELVRKWVPS